MLLGDFAVDLLVFEFLGLALVAMCVVVVALPCARKPSRGSATNRIFVGKCDSGPNARLEFASSPLTSQRFRQNG